VCSAQTTDGSVALGSWADEMEDAPMPRAGGFGGGSYGGSSDRPSYGGASGFGARTDSFGMSSQIPRICAR
jgi:translation initiation factor 4B